MPGIGVRGSPVIAASDIATPREVARPVASRVTKVLAVPCPNDWAEKVASFPASDFVPNGYVAASLLANVPPTTAAVPNMGVHWLDVASPELQPPPAGRAFTSTFLYGTWDGRFIFAEPMITKAFIESMKDRGDGVRFSVGTARKVSRPGVYPTGYAVTYDARAREYQITLKGLEQKQ